MLLTAGLVAGCAADQDDFGPVSATPQVVDAGPASQYAADGVYNQFRTQGFFIIRQGDKLFALSSTCTHRRCKLFAEPNSTFYCKCHGSTFDPTGGVTHGPARHNLPIFITATDAQGRLLVTVTV